MAVNDIWSVHIFSTLWMKLYWKYTESNSMSSVFMLTKTCQSNSLLMELIITYLTWKDYKYAEKNPKFYLYSAAEYWNLLL